ncbi:hypothetical protein CCAX7_008780 [Capsulimonas corticalis]|uniref:Uncharacterized protein n=1 Tax=Capsulimonas corticalis TaxID=2219043 RepID=A0A402CU11_9BACT|nr:hypothetical protein [Capsulimonas corticalis]BDI28827.1 hypothetical protein CCAX7_008780 [Capsulimonas corticalis]
MNIHRTLSNVLAAAAVLASLALLAAPQTGWIVRAQIKHVFSPGNPWDLDKNVTIPESKSDYSVQLASVRGDAAQKTRQARALEQRFPDTPSLYANTMRYATAGPISLYRDDQIYIEGATPPGPGQFQPRRIPSSQADLDAFDRDAANGERLDPDNAYFPAMRAIGLFAAHRDPEALAAVHRAAQKTQWREYYTDEVQGNMRKRELANGPQSEIVRTEVFASTLFPHYARLRAVTRTATYAAMQAEIHGQAARGARIRRDLMQIGGLMRAQSQSAIGALVGIALTREALNRPGGAPFIPDKDEQKPTSERIDAYCAFLQSRHLNSDIPAIRAEYEAGTTARSITDRAFESHGSALLQPFRDASDSWAVGAGMLVNSVWALALGVLAFLASRSPAIRRAAALPRRRVAGIWTGLFLGVFALSQRPPLSTLSPSSEWLSILPIVSLSAALLLTGTLLWRLRRRRSFLGEAARDAIAAFAFTCITGVIVITQVTALGEANATVQQIFDMSGEDSRTTPQPYHPILLFAIPLEIILVSAVLGLIRRIPLSVAVVRSVTRSAAATTAVGVLIYGICVLGILRDEHTLRQQNDWILQNEPQYLAQRAHQTWPGVTQWPKSES